MIGDEFFVTDGEEGEGMIFGEGVEISFAVFELGENDGDVVVLIVHVLIIAYVLIIYVLIVYL